MNKKYASRILNNPLLFGRVLWLGFTVLKLILTSFIIVGQQTMGYDLFFGLVLLVEMAAFIYLVSDPTVKRRGFYAFFLGLIALKDYSSVFYFWTREGFGIHSIHFLILAVAYLFFNQYTIRSMVVRIITYLYLVFAMGCLFFREPILVAIWFTFMAAGLIAVDILRFYKQGRENDIEEMRNDYNLLRQKYELAGAQAKTVRHDINNMLVPLEIICLEHQEKNCNTPCFDIVRDVKDKVTAMIKQLGRFEKFEFNVFSAIEEILEDLSGMRPLIRLDESLKVSVFFNRHVFKSLIFNFMENSREAYLRKHGKLKGLVLEIHARNNHIIIQDNAGGFDHARIARGRTAKKSATDENGNFLYNVLSNARTYEVFVSFSSLDRNGGKGTRVDLELM